MDIERLMRQLEIDEGVRYRVYLDHLGYKTVGIGHLLKESTPDHIRNLEVGDKITKEDCKKLFMADLAGAVQDAVTIFAPSWDKFPAVAQEVFINMVFNMGRSRMMKFKKTIVAAHAQDWATVAVEMMDSRWANQVGPRAVRLKLKIESLV